MHVTVRPTGRVIDDFGGAVLWNKDGCGNNPGPRHRIQKFTFLGRKGWTVNRRDYVFNSENYHCGITNDNAVRLPSGRIWAAFCISHRLLDPAYAACAKYSDDDGKSWVPWRPGRLAWIPQSRPTWGGSSFVVPYGEKVGVIWATTKRQYVWSLFDGKTWTKPQFVHGKYFYSAVSIGGKTPLFSGGALWHTASNVELPCVKRFDGKKWVRELTVSGTTMLCVSGKKVAAISLLGKRDGFTVHWRSPEGRWSDKPTVIRTGPVREWMVPKFGPPSFAPVLYIPKETDREARVLLIPSAADRTGN